MARAFNRDYTKFNPDPVLGPDTWVLYTSGLNPGGGGGGGPTTPTDPTPLDVHDTAQFSGDGSAVTPTTIVHLDEGLYL